MSDTSPPMRTVPSDLTKHIADRITRDAAAIYRHFLPDADEFALIAATDRLRSSITNTAANIAAAAMEDAHELAVWEAGQEAEGGIRRVDGWVVCCQGCGLTVVDEDRDGNLFVAAYATKDLAIQGMDGAGEGETFMFLNPTLCVECAVKRPELMGALNRAADHFRAEYMVEDAPGVPDYPPTEGNA